MLLIELSCQYCGFAWHAQAYSKESIDSMSCDKCGDTSLTVKPLTNKIDYYQGCPEFPEPEIELEDNNTEVIDPYARWNDIFKSTKRDK